MDKIYKDLNNGIHVIDDNFTHLLPVGCVEITQVEADTLRAIPPLTQSEQFAIIEQAIDQHIDSVAAARGYGRVGTSPSAACLGYASYQNQWQAEAIKFGQWVTSCWQYTIQEQQKIIAGMRAMPTPAAAIAELPPMVW